MNTLNALTAAGPKSLTSKVYFQLRRDIITCSLKPGEKLRIAPLRERFDVSLSAVREALSRLATEGLVEAIDQRGFRVSPVSLDDLTDLLQTRIFIESGALRESILQGDIRWESGVVAAFHELSRTPRSLSGDPRNLDDGWANAHAAFHRALLAGCKSKWLMQFRDVLYERSERYRRLFVSIDPARDLHAEHNSIMKPALERRVNDAVDALTRHFSETARILIEVYHE